MAYKKLFSDKKIRHRPAARALAKLVAQIPQANMEDADVLCNFEDEFKEADLTYDMKTNALLHVLAAARTKPLHKSDEFLGTLLGEIKTLSDERGRFAALSSLRETLQVMISAGAPSSLEALAAEVDTELGKFDPAPRQAPTRMRPATFDHGEFQKGIAGRLQKIDWESLRSDFQAIENDMWTHGSFHPFDLEKAEVLKAADAMCKDMGIEVTQSNLAEVLSCAIHAAAQAEIPDPTAQANLRECLQKVDPGATERAVQVLRHAMSDHPSGAYADPPIGDLGRYAVDPSVLKALGLQDNPFSSIFYNANPNEEKKYDFCAFRAWAEKVFSGEPYELGMDFYLDIKNIANPGRLGYNYYRPYDAAAMQALETEIENNPAVEALQGVRPSLLSSVTIHRRVSVMIHPDALEFDAEFIEFLARNGVERRLEDKVFLPDGKMHAMCHIQGSGEQMGHVASLLKDEYEAAIEAAKGIELPEARQHATRLAIATFCLKLKKLHILRDGNHRAFGLFLMNRLLVDHGLPVHISPNALQFDGSLPEQIVARMEEEDPVATT